MQTLIPSSTRLDEPALLRLRVWAANLRDGGRAELTQPSRTLIHLIDIRSRLMAKNAVETVERSILMLIGQLVVCGASAPAVKWATLPEQASVFARAGTNRREKSRSVL
jgi:hypothetical protein